MSIEINGFDNRDRKITGEVAHLAGKLCLAQGLRPDESYVIGIRGAQYSSELIFTTLRNMGIIPEEGINTEAFVATANEIMHRSGVES